MKIHEEEGGINPPRELCLIASFSIKINKPFLSKGYDCWWRIDLFQDAQKDFKPKMGKAPEVSRYFSQPLIANSNSGCFPCLSLVIASAQAFISIPVNPSPKSLQATK